MTQANPRKRATRRLKQKIGMRRYHRENPSAARENGRKALPAVERIVQERYGGDWTAWGLAMRIRGIESQRRRRGR